MKRANLHRIVSYTMFILMCLTAPFFGQSKPVGSYMSQNFVLSDFGDGYDAAKSLVWKPKFSEYVAQVPGEGADNTDNNADANAEGEIVVLGENYDPERSSVRYMEDVPQGITDIIAGPQRFVLGVKAQFTQQGYNWIELYPSLTGDGQNQAADNNQAAADGQAADAGAVAGEAQAQASATSDTYLQQTLGAVENAPDLNAEATPFRIPFAGKATELTLWTWGGYYGWWVEAYIRDYLGYQYRIPLGDLLYTGWRQKRTGIPSSIVQTRKRLPATQTLEFEMLKLWSFPSERMDQFYVYFDLLQHSSIVSTEVFNGKTLETQLW